MAEQEWYVYDAIWKTEEGGYFRMATDTVVAHSLEDAFDILIANRYVVGDIEVELVGLATEEEIAEHLKG
jgi:hypothetical protein